jgi:uncharacterized protein
MATTAELMREIHRLRRFARDLQEQIDRAPVQLKAQKAKVARHEKAATDNQDAIKKLKVTIHEKEVTLKTTHAQIAKHEKQLNEATSNKEYDALKIEITADKETSQALEEEILTAIGESEERGAKVAELDAAVRTAKAEFVKWESESGARLATLQQQQAEAQAKLKEVEASVPKDVRPSLERMVRGKGVEAFAAVESRGCASCRTEIIAQQYNELLMGAFVVCKSCGRILYLPEQPAISDEDADS